MYTVQSEITDDHLLVCFSSICVIVPLDMDTPNLYMITVTALNPLPDTHSLIFMCSVSVMCYT